MCKTAEQLVRHLKRKPQSPLRLARLRVGLRADEVAREIGIEQSMMSLLETGKRSPSMATAKKLAKFYNRRIEELFA